MDIENALDLDPKLKAILLAAFAAFTRYGFRRTSMADIAEGAGMSRGALYLHYKNKEDIFRGMIAAYYEAGSIALEHGLAQGDTITQQLRSGFEIITGPMFQIMLDSPHGGEFMDAKAAASGDVTAAGEVQMAQVLGQWIERSAQEGLLSYDSFGPTPFDVAQTILQAVFGLKASRPNYDTFVQGRDRLVVMFGAALTC